MGAQGRATAALGLPQGSARMAPAQLATSSLKMVTSLPRSRASWDSRSAVTAASSESSPCCAGGRRSSSMARSGGSSDSTPLSDVQHSAMCFAVMRFSQPDAMAPAPSTATAARELKKRSSATEEEMDSAAASGNVSEKVQ